MTVSDAIVTIEDSAKCTNCKTCYQDLSEIFEKTKMVINGESRDVALRARKLWFLARARRPRGQSFFGSDGALPVHLLSDITRGPSSPAGAGLVRAPTGTSERRRSLNDPVHLGFHRKTEGRCAVPRLS